MNKRTPNETRILLLAPTAKDGAASTAMLNGNGMHAHACRDLTDVCDRIAEGAGVVVVPEEAILGGGGSVLVRTLEQQPAWSKLPVILLTAAGLDSSYKQKAILELGDVTLLKRPLEVVTFINSVRAALRDRERQYQMRNHLAERKAVEQELLEKDERLREADRKKDDFIALLAHELRNPLAPIRNGLEVIRLSEDRAVRDRSQKIMDRQLAHMVRLVDDLLDVSRISRNKMDLRLERIALADAVNAAVETARPLIEAARHELRISLPTEAVYIEADLTRLSQVFSNLLTNSAKYTNAGGLIRLSAECDDGMVAVAVADNGIGIPAASLENIFDMFSQVDRSIERSTGGLGIGLALVKGLVEMHGGSVSAESGDRGTTFTVRLPIAQRQDHPEQTAASNGRRSHRKVLVVDDNRDGAESLALMLEMLGNDVRTAHDGIEAVEEAERFRPEVILMDVGMPRLNGLDATRRIRESPWGGNIVILALTGWGQPADRERSRDAGCNGHLVKPVHLPDLEKAMQTNVA